LWAREPASDSIATLQLAGEPNSSEQNREHHGLARLIIRDEKPADHREDSRPLANWRIMKTTAQLITSRAGFSSGSVFYPWFEGSKRPLMELNDYDLRPAGSVRARKMKAAGPRYTTILSVKLSRWPKMGVRRNRRRRRRKGAAKIEGAAAMPEAKWMVFLVDSILQQDLPERASQFIKD